MIDTVKADSPELHEFVDEVAKTLATSIIAIDQLWPAVIRLLTEQRRNLTTAQQLVVAMQAKFSPADTQEPVVAEQPSAAELRRKAIVALAKTSPFLEEGVLEIDDDSVISEGEDNGAYVQAWLWVDFYGTKFATSSESAG